MISYKQARELDLDKVAYIVLTDGSILVVRKEYGSNSPLTVSKSIDFTSGKDAMKNNAYRFMRKDLDNENVRNFTTTYIETNDISPKYDEPELQPMVFPREQTIPNYPKSEYSFNDRLYSTMNRAVANKNIFSRNNQLLNNNTYNNKYVSNTIWKESKAPEIFKYYSPYKVPNSQYLNNNQSLRQRYVIQSNNLKEKRIVQVKRPQRQIEQNKYKIIEAIPFTYTENYNNQIIDNTPGSEKYIESSFYPESINYETIAVQNDQYLTQRQPNYIYSPIKKLYRKNNIFNTFEQ